MRLGQHGHVLPFVSIGFQLTDELFHCRHIHLVERFLHGERYARVVDILRSEAEVDKFLVRLQSTDLVELLFDEILHRLHVVVRGFLNVLHALGIGLGKVFVNTAQTRKQIAAEVFQLWQRQLTKRDEILYFHKNAITDQRKLRKIGS